MTATGDYATMNPIRFSTKYTDAETGLVYFGYRFYNPDTARWLNRDPMKEAAGANLYEYVGNNPLNMYDSLGLWNDDVHRDRTAEWAKAIHIRDDVADRIGVIDARIDVSYPPQVITEGNWSWHFDRGTGGIDSRSKHYLDKFEDATQFCTSLVDLPHAAAANIGSALHALQDIVAHGGYNRYLETPRAGYGLGVDSLYYIHNYAAKGEGSTDWPDDSDLDAYGSLSGVPTIEALKQAYSVHLSNGDVVYGIQYSVGHKRRDLTRSQTESTLRDFQNYVRSVSHEGCECWKAYIGRLR